MIFLATKINIDKIVKYIFPHFVWRPGENGSVNVFDLAIFIRSVWKHTIEIISSLSL